MFWLKIRKINFCYTLLTKGISSIATLCISWRWLLAQIIFQCSLLKYFFIIKRLAITLMYHNKVHDWWSTQSQLATLLSSLIARQQVGLQTLWRYSVLCTVRYLSVLCFLLISWFICSKRSFMNKLWIFHANLYLLWSTFELRVRLALWI